jgi:phosphatidate cytidylyltransferase
MLRTRVITALILGPVVLAVALLGEPWMSLLLGAVAFLALVEVISLLDAGGYQPPQVLGIGLGMALTASFLVSINSAVIGGPLAGLLQALDQPGLVTSTAIAAMLLLAAASFTRSDAATGYVSWSMTMFGILYIGLLLPTIALVGHLAPVDGSSTTPVGVFDLHSGTAWLLMLILVVWGYDTGAYLVGRQVGRTRLLEHISPAKTVEGLAGGLVLATVAAGVGALLIGLDPWHPLLIGPLVGIVAQVGDLSESMLKRAAGRKDSGGLIPGHGGILDRIDSFLFAAPVLAGYALLVAGRTV